MPNLKKPTKQRKPNTKTHKSVTSNSKQSDYSNSENRLPAKNPIERKASVRRRKSNSNQKSKVNGHWKVILPSNQGYQDKGSVKDNRSKHEIRSNSGNKRSTKKTKKVSADDIDCNCLFCDKIFSVDEAIPHQVFCSAKSHKFRPFCKDGLHLHSQVVCDTCNRIRTKFISRR